MTAALPTIRLNSFVARLNVQLLDGKTSLNLPAKITVWEGVLGYNLHTTSPSEPIRIAFSWRPQ